MIVFIIVGAVALIALIWSCISILQEVCGINIDLSRNHVQNTISFKSFIAFYQLRPDKWELRKNYVIYKVVDMDKFKEIENAEKQGGMMMLIMDRNLIRRTCTKTYEFAFKFLDGIKYRLWHKWLIHDKDKKKKRDEQQRNYEKYQEALDYIKQDLEKFKQSKPWEDIK